MKLLLLGFLGFAFLTGCGTESSLLNSTARQDQVSTVSLTEGEYVLEFSAFEGCSPSAYNLKKHLALTTFIPEIGFEVAAPVIEHGMIRTAVCRSGLNTASAVVNIGTYTHITAPEGFAISDIRKITKKAHLKIAQTSRLNLGKGEYIITVSGQDDCNAGARNFAYDLFYGRNLSLEKMVLRHNGTVTDDLIRTAVCRPGPTMAKGFLNLTAATSLRTSEELVMDVEVIQETEKVDFGSEL